MYHLHFSSFKSLLFVHVCLEEVRGEKRNGKEREEEKMREKENHSQFHYLV